MGLPSLLVWPVVAVAAVAQQRGPCFLTVVDNAGKPLAGVTVTCTSAGVGMAVSTDTVVVTSDARGRVRPELITGGVYVAWAVGAVGADGDYLASAPLPLLAAGRVADLRAAYRGGRRRIAVAGTAAWRDENAQLFWYPVAGQDVRVPVVMTVADEVELPPSPWCAGQLVLADASGQPIVGGNIAAGAATRVEFAAPRLVTVFVHDAASAPIVGAEVRYEVPGVGVEESLVPGVVRPRTSRLLGRTDGAGELRGVVADPPLIRGLMPHPLAMLVAAPGYAPAAVTPRLESAVAVTMAAASPVSIRLNGLDVGAVELEAFAPWMLRGRPERGERWGMGGLVALDVRRGAADWTLSAGSNGIHTRWTVAGEVPTAAVVEYIQPRAGANIELDVSRAVAVRVLGTDGAPAAAVCSVTHVGEAVPMLWATSLATDKHGNARLHLHATHELCVYATTGSHHALALVDATSVELRLEPIPTMRVRVLDADGNPQALARVVPVSSTYRSSGGESLDRQWDRVGESMATRYLTLAEDLGDGWLRVPAFVRPGFEARVEVRIGDRQSPGFLLRPDTEIEVVVPR